MVYNCLLTMSREHEYSHVVQLRLTREEWRLIASIASLRRVSVEDLLREFLRLNRADSDPPPAEPTTPLRVVRPSTGRRPRRLRRRP